MKKLLATLLLFVLTLTAAYSIVIYNHMHLNGKWYAYAYHKADGTYYKFEEGLLFLEFIDINKVRLHILDKEEVSEILFSERKLIDGFYYTHVKLKNANESWLFKEKSPNDDFAIIEILKGNFPLKYEVDYRVLISKKENYFANLKEPKELPEEPKKSEEPKELEKK